MKETQEMIDFYAEHNIVSDIEMIKMQDISYRFLINLASLKSAA